MQSTARVAALGKYLTALANSFTADVATSRQAREPSSKRKRLHILYVLNDVLYHVHVRRQDPGLCALVEPFLPGLVESAAAFANCPKHVKKISELASLWEEHGYFSSPFTCKLKDTIRDAPTSHAASAANGAPGAITTTNGKLSKDAPFVMPAMHGDASVPWYDLPAANWLPVIEPNSSRPMNPSMVKPLQFMPGPADKVLVKAVQDLLTDVDRIYAKDVRLGEDPTDDIDLLGQRVVLDEVTGDVVGGETYYGWSRNFCEKMKQRRKKADGPEGDRRGRSQSRTESRSPSRSSSRPAFKRRRMSDPRSSRSRSRSRSDSRRRSHSRARRRPRSYSRSRSRSPRGDRRYHRSRSQSQEYSPPPPPGSKNYDTPSGNGQHKAFPNAAPPFPPGPPNVSFPFAATPPPPPPNWQGPWPPPPPPPPMAGAMPNWMSQVGPPPPLPGGGWGVPPPAQVPPPPRLPPPPPGVPFDHQQPQQQGAHFPPGGHGGRGDYRGGRGGGWRGGRGGW